MEWRNPHVLDWLRENDYLEKWIEPFKENNVRGKTLLKLTDEMLKNYLKLDQPLLRERILEDIESERQKFFNKAPTAPVMATAVESKESCDESEEPTVLRRGKRKRTAKKGRPQSRKATETSNQTSKKAAEGLLSLYQAGMVS